MRRLPLEQARLLPRFRLEPRQPDAFVAEHEYSSESAATTSSPRWKTPVGDDIARLRGLPAIGRGVAGAQSGTQPERALLAKEGRRRR